MVEIRGPHNVGPNMAIALADDSIMSSLAGLYDLVEFCGAHSATGRSRLVGVCSAESNQYGFMRCVPPSADLPIDYILVPALEVAPVWQPQRHRALIQWIRQSYRRGACVIGIGSGAFLLAEAGLFDGGEAAIHPSVRAQFARCYPDIALTAAPWARGERLLCSGDLPWYEPVLYLLAGLWGKPLARLAARTYSIHWSEAIAEPDEAERQQPHAEIVRARHWLSQHYREDHAVSRCAAYVGMPKRSFNRRFKEVAGTTPIDFVQKARIVASQQLLLSTQSRIEDIGHAVGYEDIASFRKLFRRYSGVPPGEFRRRQCTA